MKKRLYIIAVLIVLFMTSSTTLAESTNPFDGIPTEDLVLLLNAINAELEARNYVEEGVTVPLGLYEVGVDIPAGTYSISHSGKEYVYGTTDVYYVAQITVLKNDLSLEYISHKLYRGDSIGKITLTEGLVVGIKGAPVVFHPYKGLGF